MWTLASCFALAVASALFPWVNAEVMLVVAATRMRSAAALAALVAVVTAGQVSGKTALYWMRYAWTFPAFSLLRWSAGLCTSASSR